MTDTDRIAQMAREAGFTVCRNEWLFAEMLDRFARLVAEDCAKTVDEHLTKGRSPMGKVAAQAIRYRYSKP